MQRILMGSVGVCTLAVTADAVLRQITDTPAGPWPLWQKTLGVVLLAGNCILFGHGVARAFQTKA